MALDLDTIRSTADRVAASHGLEIVDLEYLGSAKHRILRVFIEKNATERARLAEQPPDKTVPENVSAYQLAGISIEDCERFSDDFGTILDVEDLIPGGEYSLEISSPGLDRKLHGRADFERFIGSLVKLRTAEPIEGNSHWQGRIGSVQGDTLELQLPAPSGGKKPKAKAPTETARSVTIALSNIVKANLVPEL